MKTKLFFLSLAICGITQAQITFQKTIGGGSDWDYGYTIIQATDGGYAIAGTTYSFGAGGPDVYVVKLDSNGNLLWTKTIWGSNDDVGSSIIQTNDDSYAICGSTFSFGTGYADVYVIKLDSSGNLLWTKTIGGSNDDIGSSIIQTNDSGYAIVGHTYSFGTGYAEVYVIKLDSNGNLLWTKTIGGSNNDYGSSIIQTADGNYVVCGVTSFGAGFYDVYVVKLDSSGNLLWTKTIGGGDYDWSYSIIQDTDGNYVICGETASFGAGFYDVYVVKLEGTGNLLWTKTIGGNDYNRGNSIIQATDGNYVICGYTGLLFSADSADVYVVKLNGSGNLLWTKTIGGGKDDYSTSIIQSADGNYVVCGGTKSFGTGGFDVYVAKLDGSGNTCDSTGTGGVAGSGGTLGSGGIISTVSSIVGSGGSVSSGGTLANVCTTFGVNEFSLNALLILFPNPTSGKFYLSLSPSPLGEERGEIEIYNVLGEKVYEDVLFPLGTGYITLPAGTRQGIYFLHIKTEQGTAVRKLIIQK